MTIQTTIHHPIVCASYADSMAKCRELTAKAKAEALRNCRRDDERRQRRSRLANAGFYAGSHHELEDGLDTDGALGVESR